MKQTTYLLLLSAGPLFISLTANAQKTNHVKKGDKPNVIILLADDQGYGGVNCYPHHKRVITPNIDELAKGGVQFMQAYTSGHVSSPSRAGIFTGQYQQNFGFYGLGEPHVGGIPQDTKMLAEYMKDMGYATACVGKWHMGDYLRTHPSNRGYDYFCGFIGGQHDYFAPEIGHSWEGGSHGLSFIMENFSPIPEMKYSTYEFTDRAISFIENNRNHPFFLHLAFNAIHGPIEAPEDLIRLYADDSENPNRDDVVRAMTVALDNSIGRIVEKLKELGIRENTLIFYLSDNGGATFSDNWNLRGSKGSYYEGGIRVPFIVNWPNRIPKDKKYDKPIIATDIAPTILSAAEYDGKTEMDGVNLLPFITTKTQKVPHDIIYWSIEHKNDITVEVNEFAVRQGKWKLVSDPRLEKDCNLYDIDADPFERNGLKDKYPKKYQEMYQHYLSWIKTKPASILHNGNERLNGNSLIKIFNVKRKNLGLPQVNK